MPHLRPALAEALGPLYRVEREVRPVGACRLFVARALPSGPDLLIKVLPAGLSFATDADVFERELRSVAGHLRDHRLVPPSGAGRVASYVFHTRPFVAGTTLHASLQRNGPLPLTHAVDILRDVLGALQHAHDAQVAHGDLRAENVLLTDGRAAVADTGVVGALSRSLTGNAPNAACAAVCDALYLAPESRDSDVPTEPRSDLFAVGVLIHVMLAGRPPEPEGERVDELRSVPEWLDRVMERCLAPDPADRWAHASEALALVPGRP